MTKKNILNPNGKSRRIEISESVPFHEERKRFLEHMLDLGWKEHVVRIYELRIADFAAHVDIMTPGGISATQIELAADDWLKMKDNHRSNFSRNDSRKMFIRAAKRWLLFLGRLREREPGPYAARV